MSHATDLTRRERMLIAEHLRSMAADTHTLLNLADANMCGDIAAILRARASRLEQPEEASIHPSSPQPKSTIYSQV